MPNQPIEIPQESVNDKLQFLFYQVIGINYTLKELSVMPFEQWAKLIELENKINNA